MNETEKVESSNSVIQAIKRNKTLILAAITGVLTSFLLLERRNIVGELAYDGAIDQFFTWLHRGHTNGYVFYITPVIFVLLAKLIHFFIDYAKNVPEKE